MKYFLSKLICLIVVLTSFSSCAQKKAENTIRIIPDGYTGPVLIIFDQDAGTEKEYDDGSRVYKIPQSGVLKTKFSSNYGIQTHSFYYEDSNGNLTQIPFVNIHEIEENGDQYEDNVIYAYGERAIGEGEKYDPESKKLLYITPAARTFYIGYLNDMTASNREQMKFNFEHLGKARKSIKQD